MIVDGAGGGGIDMPERRREEAAIVSRYLRGGDEAWRTVPCAEAGQRLGGAHDEGRRFGDHTAQGFKADGDGRGGDEAREVGERVVGRRRGGASALRPVRRQRDVARLGEVCAEQGVEAQGEMGRPEGGAFSVEFG